MANETSSKEAFPSDLVLNQLTLDTFVTRPDTPEKKTIIVHTFGTHNVAAFTRATELGISVDVPIFDCMRLPNPYHNLSTTASDYEILVYFQNNTRFKRLVTEAGEIARKYRSIACFCFGGRHRSIAVALALKERLKKGWDVRIIRHY